MLLILGGFAASIAASGDGSSMTPPASAGLCNEGLEGGVSLLKYYEWLRAASADKQTKQYRCANSFAAHGKPHQKLVLAMTLIVPDAPFADFARAKVLLTEYLQNADEEKPEDRVLASLMLTLLDEVARLQEQLEQLKAIEKDITQTEQSVNVPAPTPAPLFAPKENLEKDDTVGR